MLGIIGALQIEVDSLCEKMIDCRQRLISGIEYNIGILYGLEVVAAVSGVGKVNAAICAQTMILMFNVDCIINTGIAGGVYDALKIGDIVIGTSVVQHDMDTSAVGDPIGFISGKGLDRINIPLSKSIADKIAIIGESMDDIDVYKGVIATGDQFLNDTNKNIWLKDTFDAYAVDMESASIGMVCYVNGIDCGIIRSISDGGDDNSHMDFPAFARMAAKNAAYLLERYIKLNGE